MFFLHIFNTVARVEAQLTAQAWPNALKSSQHFPLGLYPRPRPQHSARPK